MRVPCKARGTGVRNEEAPPTGPFGVLRTRVGLTGGAKAVFRVIWRGAGQIGQVGRVGLAGLMGWSGSIYYLRFTIGVIVRTFDGFDRLTAGKHRAGSSTPLRSDSQGPLRG